MVFDYVSRERTETTLVGDLFKWWRRAPLNYPKGKRLPVVRGVLKL
jgi:hypothetical protein